MPCARLADPRLLELLGEPQRLLRRVDREHVVARVHVERGRLLVEVHELQAGRAVLQEVDALLVALDRLLALAAVPQARADLAVQVGDAREVLLLAVVLERLLPQVHGGADAPHAEGHVGLLLGHARDGARVVRAVDLLRGLVVIERLGVGVQRRRGVAGSLQVLERLAMDLLGVDALHPALCGDDRGAPEVLGQQRDDLVRALAGTVLEEAADVEVLARADGLGQHPVGDVADQDVLERVLPLARRVAHRRRAR